MTSPGSDQLMHMATAFQKSRILLTAFDLDVFSALGEEGADSRELSSRLGLNSHALDRLLNGLCAIGVLIKEDGRFKNTSGARRFLCRGSSDYMAELELASTIYTAWANLTEIVRTGQRGRPEKEGEISVTQTELFIRAMHHRSRANAQETAGSIGLEGASKVLDLGGGSGVHSIAFARANPGLRAVVFDLPEVAELARNFIRKENLLDRIAVIGGDITTDDPGQGYDLVFVSAVIHMLAPDQCRLLMKKGFNCLAPGGRIALRDFIMEEDRTRPSQGAIFALNMLVNTRSGDTYTRRELASWLDQAGFIKIRRNKLAGPAELLIATKPG